MRRLIRGPCWEPPQYGQEELAQMLGLTLKRLRQLERRRENLRDLRAGRNLENILG